MDNGTIIDLCVKYVLLHISFTVSHFMFHYLANLD